ncbi:MHYT domain-containing protein [Methylobacterium aerolatum]|uniref:histidine kinase n=1 Tax=Methylobacterium aerolatum TaxID=418708 RepID=A0ABU0I4L8_9HYPH|nr:MHYT domain-containing protein [Methylobacterium aerolatum]MDQ0449556.1 PAS domain S-box-containing protein [Methylobacterium aerolatum]GJD33586.1 Adaptive-response sensory-kinase SasA [Methylobacterium aerolatum]
MSHSGFSPALVALSVAIAMFAAYTALDLMERARRFGESRLDHGKRRFWVAGAAVTMGGGIWSMHFVGMLALERGMWVSYDLGLTALSLAIAVGVTGAAFAWVATRSTAGEGKPGDAPAPDAGAEGRPGTILVAGPLMGLGIALMHYTGMAAMRVPGGIAYDPALVALSLAIAMVAATVGLRLAFRRNGLLEKLAAAAVMGIAVAGMHYTGMAAATFGPMAHETPAEAGMMAAPENLALATAGATFLILFLGMLAIAIDQRRIQAELAASEARFRAAVEAVRGVLWTNDAQGRMVGPQPGWAAITGQSFAEYQGFGWADAVHPEDAEPSIAAWNETVAARKTFVFEHRVRTRDGTYRHYAIRAVPVLNADGSIREWVGVHTDITAQREAEAELRESNEEIQRYAYIVSHDLRAPLVNVMGFTSELAETQGELRTLLAGHPDAERIDGDMGEALGFIGAAVTRMERLIAAILKLSREGRRRFEPEPLDMTALIQRLADATRHQTGTQNATVGVAPGLPGITADRLAVEQIFGNLLDNALKYLEHGRPGRITVTGEVLGTGRVRFTVADNGRGIAPQDHARVFELFRRSGTQDRPGEGIGLAHVKALVRALGGRIDLTSRPGEGSSFTVTLPRGAAMDRGAPAPLSIAAE